MMKSWFLTAIAGVFLLSGCTSDDSTSCPEPYTGPLTAEEENLSDTWVLTGLEGAIEIDLTDDDTDNPATDILAQLDECVSNARYEFGADRVGSYYASELVNDTCEDRLLFQGSWRFEDSVIHVNAGCAALRLEVSFDEETGNFSYVTYENVRNYKDQVIPMEVTYIFSRVTE